MWVAVMIARAVGLWLLLVRLMGLRLVVALGSAGGVHGRGRRRGKSGTGVDIKMAGFRKHVAVNAGSG